ncbi:ABC transporter ATP-binding protein [Pleurocapsa sp. PCC 7319]|uniref:ABC transporter ATP-binding protein n=1 Tax=Pleurocapsa sp. PCC 7319 TaxID=118161 RepID=UPI0003453E1D|nr:ABC transporter ATP-binding protein [Pleurocapsa sp. PCC 7319]
MSEAVIKVENLGKKYTIGKQKQEKYTALRDVIADGAKSIIHRITNSSSQASSNREEFWALKDVSFEINQGDRVGIIGRNGAGKSTLLKVLSRITEPTTGRIKLRGRVASLLEVGTGFHPELTGRENIFLNGAILGMTKVEIKKKFDEIVDFAEVEKHLDTPVKRYSSGMYVRLAFAVAAHLEPEILIVDEVLAVGDAAFQKKCLGKMESAGQEGRTILFVSHNMSMVQNLCTRGILLQQGKISTDSSIENAVNCYLKTIEQSYSENLLDRQERIGKGQSQVAKVKILSDSGETSTLVTGKFAQFLFEITNLLPRLSCMFTIYDQLGTAIINFNSEQCSSHDLTNPEIGAKFICEIEQLPLLPGQYRLNVLIKGDGIIQDHLEGAAWFDVEPGAMQDRPIKIKDNGIKICVPHIWTVPV